MVNLTTARIITIASVALNSTFRAGKFHVSLIRFFDEQKYGLQRRMDILFKVFMPLRDAAVPLEEPLQELRPNRSSYTCSQRRGKGQVPHTFNL